MKIAPRHLAVLLPLAVFFVIGVIYNFSHGLPAAATDLSLIKARGEVDRLRSGKKRMPALAEWNKLRRTLERAAATAPNNAQVLDDLAFLYAFRATTMADNEDLVDLYHQLLAEAAGYYRQAAPLRPMFPYPWANLALADHLTDSNEAEMWSAFDKALAFGRNEPTIQAMLAEIAFARWSQLTPERADAMRRLVAEMPETLQGPLRQAAERHAIDLLDTTP